MAENTNITNATTEHSPYYEIVKDFYDQFALYQKVKQIESKYPYDLNDEYVLKQTCIEDEDTALADGNESLNAETISKEDGNDKTSSVNMKTIGIISGISLAGIGLIILMLKRKKKRK